MHGETKEIVSMAELGCPYLDALAASSAQFERFVSILWEHDEGASSGQKGRWACLWIAPASRLSDKNLTGQRGKQ